MSPEQRRVFEDFRDNYASMIKQGLKEANVVEEYERKSDDCHYKMLGEFNVNQYEIEKSWEKRNKNKGGEYDMSKRDEYYRRYKEDSRKLDEYARKADKGLTYLLNDLDGMFERLKKAIEILEELQVPSKVIDRMNSIDKDMREHYVDLKGRREKQRIFIKK